MIQLERKPTGRWYIDIGDLQRYLTDIRVQFIENDSPEHANGVNACIKALDDLVKEGEAERNR